MDNKKIKLKRGRQSWEPPPSVEERLLPLLIGLAIFILVMGLIIR